MTMSRFTASVSSGRQVVISLRGLSHEVCVAATQASYWQQLTQGSSISISYNGHFIPIELESICNDVDEPRLRLVIQSQTEQDNAQLDTVCARIRFDLTAFENNDRPIFEPSSGQVSVFGSLFNSLPPSVFDSQRHMLGQRHSKIKHIRQELACSVYVDETEPQRFRFTLRQKHLTVLQLAVIQIQALVKQTQYEYLIAFTSKLGQQIIGPVNQMEISQRNALSDVSQFPSFTPFEPSAKRKRGNDKECQLTTSVTSQTIPDSDDSDDDDTMTDERRQQCRQEMEDLLTHICNRMQARMPIDDKTSVNEDWSQIKSYFRSSSTSKSGSSEPEMTMELVEHEIDLRARGMHEHKCTLVFNKQLKMGAGVRDRVKRAAKLRAYEQLKIMTRNTSRQTLIVKQTRDKRWKVVMFKNDS